MESLQVREWRPYELHERAEEYSPVQKGTISNSSKRYESFEGS
jgi:hypothetical protein